LAEVIVELGAQHRERHTGLGTKRGRRQLLFELSRRRQIKFADGKLAADEIFKESKYEDHLGNNFNNSKVTKFGYASLSGQ
jgi:hypothetical protein